MGTGAKPQTVAERAAAKRLALGRRALELRKKHGTDGQPMTFEAIARRLGVTVKILRKSVKEAKNG